MFVYEIIKKECSFVGILFNEDKTRIEDLTEALSYRACKAQLDVLAFGKEHKVEHKHIIKTIDYSTFSFKLYGQKRCEEEIDLLSLDFIWDVAQVINKPMKDTEDYEMIYIKQEIVSGEEF